MFLLYSISNVSKNLLGKQSIIKNAIYRPMIYNKFFRFEDSMIVFNTLTGQMYCLDSNEYFVSDKIIYSENIKKLIENWILVPEKFNESMLLQQVENISKSISKNNYINKYSSYTIFTTTDCNARCYYCFERGSIPINMSSKTALDVSKFIVANSNENKCVKIRWFGGEPLLNHKVIDVICNFLSSNNIVYQSSMVTNASLVTDEIIYKSIHFWNLDYVQITIDGTQSVYNKTKNYINFIGDPYTCVINNIRKLLDNGIKVLCRLNVTLNNYNNLFDLIEELYLNFASHSSFSINLKPIYNYDENGKRKILSEEIISKFQELEELIYNKGLLHIQEIKIPAETFHCMADRDDAVVILADGRLGKCNYYCGSGEFGDIYTNKINTETIDKYKVFNDNFECINCNNRPICLKIKACPNFIDKCNDYKRLFDKRVEYWMRAKCEKTLINKRRANDI